MSAPSHVSAGSLNVASALIDALLAHGIDCGFGIPSIHNIALYDALRQRPQFQHWIARHEQAATFAADGFCRRNGKPAVVFASTGPGNLFTLAGLLESFQTNTPLILVGTNVASSILGKTCGALHETPQQLEIIKPLTRFATRISRPEDIPGAVASAAKADGPAFLEISHDVLMAPAGSCSTAAPGCVEQSSWTAAAPGSTDKPSGEIVEAITLISQSRTPVIVAGSGVDTNDSVATLKHLAETLSAPVLTTTSGKGIFADDHPLSMGCISRLGAAQEVLVQSDLLISVGARFTEFDTGRFSLKVPAQHVQIGQGPEHAGFPYPAASKLFGDVSAIVQDIADHLKSRQPWCDVPGIRSQERKRLESLHTDAWSALMLLHDALDRDDVVANDQSILNYWASTFFPVFAPRTFLYPSGSGTLGYGLPAAIGAACANRKLGKNSRVICIAGDGGFQYTSHELATLAQYNLPVKILLVNDSAYGIIGFLQRTMFGHTHEVELKNPDFCVLAEAYGIPAQRVTDFAGLRRQFDSWINAPGPALLEWRTELKAPWEAGAVNRPTGLQPAKS